MSSSTQQTKFDLKAASCVPAISLLASLALLYLLDSAVIHIPFYEDFELLVFAAAFNLLAGLYAARSDSYHFVAAALSALTAFFSLRAIFVYQQFVNRCDARGSFCALALAFRFATSLAFFLTLVPVAGLYGAAVYVFLSADPKFPEAPSQPPVVVGLPAEKRPPSV